MKYRKSDIIRKKVTFINTKKNSMATIKSITSHDINGETELSKFLKTHETGRTIKYNQYISTTAGTRYNELSNIELHIKSKTGKDIRKLNKEEQEILFKRNTTFKVIKTEKIGNEYHIYMEEVNE